MRRLLLALPFFASSVLADPAALKPLVAPTPPPAANIIVLQTDAELGTLRIPLDSLVDAGAAPAVAEPAKPATKDVDPETQAWLDHCQLLEERGIGRGVQIGGNGAFGLHPGGKGQADQIGDVDPAVRASVDSWNEQGALVLSVISGSPAAMSGLEPGDIIVQIAGLWVDTPDMLIRMASRAEVGKELEILYLREGQIQRTWISAIDRKDMEKL